jgi:hypothetical protein
LLMLEESRRRRRRRGHAFEGAKDQIY